MTCSKCGKDHKEYRAATGAICGGVGNQYQARTRWHGYRRWDPVGKPTESYAVAVRRMAVAFSKGHCKRADVIMWAEYYDPVQLCELVRR